MRGNINQVIAVFLAGIMIVQLSGGETYAAKDRDILQQSMIQSNMAGEEILLDASVKPSDLWNGISTEIQEDEQEQNPPEDESGEVQKPVEEPECDEGMPEEESPESDVDFQLPVSDCPVSENEEQTDFVLSGDSSVVEPQDTYDEYTYVMIDSSHCRITKYTGTDIDIIIPEIIDGYTVSEIGSSAFFNNTTLESIVMPDSVTTIQINAFCACTNLKKIELSECLTTVGIRAFYGCTKLSDITIPAGVTTIEKETFYNCSGLENISLSEHVMSIGEFAFFNCVSLADITLPASITMLGAYAFSGCTGLMDIDLPDGLTTIGSCAFYQCTGLQNVSLPVNWTTVASYNNGYSSPFAGCSGITLIEIPTGMREIPDYAFRSCSSLQFVAMPISVTNVGMYSFSGCTALKQITWSSNIETIGDYAFNGCTALTVLERLDHLTKIADYAFYGCSGLTEVNFSDCLTYIGSSCFGNCTKLTSADIPQNVTYLGSRAFYNCNGLLEIHLPDSLQEIKESTFGYCARLSSIKLPDSITTIGAYAFRNCSALVQAELPAGWTTVSGTNSPFYNCAKLTTIILPEGMQNIPAYAFCDLTSLDSVQISSSVKEIEQYAFKGCSSLLTIVWSDGLEKIGSYAFQGCTALKSLELPDSVASISSRAFYNCTGITDVVLPVSWTTVSDDTGDFVTENEAGSDVYRSPFEGCSSWKTVVIPYGMKRIPAYAFRYAAAPQTVVTPDTVTAVGDYAFEGCTALSRVWIGESVTEIGTMAFNSCGELTIHGVENSYVHGYAEVNQIPFSSDPQGLKIVMLSGTAKDNSGNILEGVSVAIYSETEKKTQLLKTKEDGTWTYENAVTGYCYQIRYFHQGYEFEPEMVAVEALPEGNCFDNVCGMKLLEWEDTAESEFTCEITEEGYCSITGYTGSGSTVIIPVTLNGCEVRTISDSAFKDNSNLVTIILPEYLESIGAEAFSGCISLSSVLFNNNLKDVGSKAFYGCKNISEIRLPNTAVSIGQYAFSECTALIVFSAGGMLDVIGESAFAACIGLRTVDLPDQVTTVWSNAFSKCTNLEKVKVPACWESVRGSTSPFNGCTKLAEVIFPKGMETIPYASFYNCDSLKAILLPEGLTSIERSSFADCNALESVQFPDGLETIQGTAFNGCTKLSSVILPDSVVSIAVKAFGNCTALTKVRLSAGWEIIPNTSGNTNYWYPSSDCASPFFGCTNLVAIELPEGMTKIPKYAFMDLSNLSEIVIPDGVTSIEECAFYGCSSLQRVELPESLGSIGQYLFYNCKSLEQIELPESITSISDCAFSGCSSLQDIIVPRAVTSIGDYAFSGCSSLQSIELPESITCIYSYAFSGCHKLKKLVLPDHITAISARAFYNCTGLTEVKLPVEWTTVLTCQYINSRYYASPFEGCSSLRVIQIPEGMTSLPMYAFRYVSTLEAVFLPDSVTSIGNYAFEGCTGMTGIRIGAQVSEIGEMTFEDCTSLTIHGTADTYVQSYAEAHDIPFTTDMLEVDYVLISGRVVDNTGNGICGVQVGIYDFKTGKTEIIATGEDGTWQDTSALRAHKYQIRFYLQGYQFDTSTIVVEALPEGTEVSPVTAVRIIEDDCEDSAAESFTYSILDNGSCAITAYTGSDEIVVIPGELNGYPVQTIANEAFANHDSVRMIVLPVQLESLGNMAFSGCTALEQVYFNNTLQSVGESAFSGCICLRSVNLPNTVNKIGKSAFSRCSALSEFSAGSLVTSIYSYTFQDCVSLSSFEFPVGVTSIASAAFSGCEGLSEIALPAGWNKVLGLDGSTSNYSSPFAGCSALTTVTIPEDAASIPDYAFKDHADLHTVYFHAGVTKLGEYSFQNCTGLTSMNLPDSIDYIGRSTFSGCTGLQNVKLPAQITRIYAYVFENCTALESIDLPDSITSIDAHAFYCCTGLVSVQFPVSWITVFGSSSPFTGCTNLVHIELPDGITAVPAYAFRNHSSLQSIVIPDSVTEIGKESFEDCTSLTGIYVPDGVTAIDTGAFKNCSNLSNVQLADGVISICSNAFENCIGLMSIDLPDSVTSISARAFYNCTSLAEVHIPLGWTTVPDYSSNTTTKSEGDNTYTSPFEGCSALTDIVISEGMTEVPKYAFRKMSVLQSIFMPDSVAEIGAYAFEGCTVLNITQWPAGLSTIQNCAFLNCAGLENLNFPDNVVSVGQGCFRGCSGLRAVEMNDTLAELGEGAFADCSGMTSMTIGSTLRAIPAEEFSNCTNLSMVYIPNTVVSIAASAFDGCSELTIYCYSGSAAHQYAESREIPFILLDNHEHVYEITVEIMATCERGGIEVHRCTSCPYYFIAFSDSLGHILTEDWIIDIDVTCTGNGQKSHHCIRCGKFIDVTAIPALGHLFGGWIVGREASIFEDGYRYRICERCQLDEREIIPKTEIDPSENEGYGMVQFTVVDAVTLQPVEGASIYIPTESDGEGTLRTDTEGKAEQILPVGLQKVTVFKDGYLSRNITVTISPGENVVPVIGISTKPVVEAQLTTSEMTPEEMEEAGIVGETHVVKSEITIQFEEELNLNFLAYFDDQGNTIEPDTPPDYYQGSSNSGTLSDGQSVTVFPISEKFYLIVYGEVSWVKEIFDVELLVINNSNTDTIENCVASLSLPDGLSLARLESGEGQQQNLVQTIGHIGEGVNNTAVHWYVCGDEEGSYDISAELSGTVMPHNESFYYEYTAASPIKVYAGTALHLTYEVPDMTYSGDHYTMRIILENVSDKTLYGVKNQVLNMQQMTVSHYSKAGVAEEYVSVQDNTEIPGDFARELKPGDKIVVEGTTDISFFSLNLWWELSYKAAALEHSEQFSVFCGLFKKSISILQDTVNTVRTAKDTISEVIAASANDIAKQQCFQQLAKANDRLLVEIESGDWEIIHAWMKLKQTNTGAAYLELIRDPDAYYEQYTAEDISHIADALSMVSGSGMLAGDDQSVEDTGKIYDLIRNAMSMIPIHYQLDNVITTSLEGSTTTIPCSVVVNYEDPDYVGIANVGAAFAEMMRDIFGEYDTPSNAAGLHMDWNRMNAEQQEKLVFAIVEANPQGPVKVYVEPETQPASQSVRENTAQPTGGVHIAAETEEFTLTTDNDTVQYDENGVMNFTGSGMIQVIPNSNVNGTLYIEAGGEKRQYYLNVIENHACDGSSWISVIQPERGECGYQVKLCDICGDIIDVREAVYCTEHDFGNAAVHIAASCDHAGTSERVCRDCGYTEMTLIEASPHTVSEWTVVQEAACTIEGMKNAVCSVCGQTITQVFPALGHTPASEWEIILEPTPYTEGRKALQCTVCGVILQEETIPKLPAPIVSVDIVWNSMEFTYTDGKWDPRTHTQQGNGWSCREGADSITITNKSNVPVTALFIYESFDVYNGISGIFTEREQTLTEPLMLEEGQRYLVRLRLHGKPEQNMTNQSIGSVSVMINAIGDEG